MYIYKRDLISAFCFDELLQSCLASRYCEFNNGGFTNWFCFGDFAVHYPLIMEAHPSGKSCFRNGLCDFTLQNI